MPKELQLLYFKNTSEWREWLHENHAKSEGVELIFYRINSSFESMRWEEAVQVALCYGWIDSVVKRIGDEQRKQLFTPRKNKSPWSRLNKTYIENLINEGLMHESGLKKIEIAKQNSSWESQDGVENLEVPVELQKAFEANPKAYDNYQKFSKTYQKNYLFWFSQAKREGTQIKRIAEIIDYCERNIKQRE